MFRNLPKLFYFLMLSTLLFSCVGKKEILYFQDAEKYDVTDIIYKEYTIQPNDILSVTISAAVPEAAIPYNMNQNAGAMVNTANIDVLKLQGYLVNSEGYITIPVLGKILANKKTSNELEKTISDLLEKNGHLIDPIVNVRLLNAKVTVLGEVKVPGTYGFTEQNLTVPQVLGYAGDLTINGKRDDIILIRELDGKRKITHIDLTTANWMENPEYIIKPNDVLVVQPNDAKIKTAGYVGNVSTIVAIASLLLSTTILLTR